MKRRNRDINIFNLSMLDVISGAMGAFLIIMVILLPYYKKESIDYQKELKQARAAEYTAHQAAQTAQAAQRAAQAEADQSRQRADAATQQLAKTFLLVHIQWDTKYQDVDLHVVDPGGTEFWYEHKSYPGQPGELSVDSQYGPGNEVWRNPSAAAGDYRVYATLYNLHGVNDTPVVTGSVIHRDGATALPATRLLAKQEKYLVATVTVGAQGRVTIR
ncbi:MAG: YfaP family protein [Rhodoferax sp.]